MNPRIGVLALGCWVASVICPAQIGTKMADARLPLISSSPRVTQWQSAGYLCQRSMPIYYTLQVNVRDLGAVGDGSADDTAAFTSAISQAATEAASGGFTIVYAPAGTYKFTSTLNLSNSMVLKGDGASNTTLYACVAAGNYIVISSKTVTGVEDLKLTNNAANADANVITFASSHDGWVRGVESDTAPKYHISIANSYRIEVRECYMHHSLNYGGGGYGYGVPIDTGSYYCLVENNIFRHLRHSMLFQNDVHWNVVGYNASFDPYRDEIPQDFAGDIVFHGHWDANRSGPYENLAEGNDVVFVHFDNSHDMNGNYNLVFRNRGNPIGLQVNSANNENIVNNYFRCPTWAYCLIGLPWSVSGSGHFTANNYTRKVNFFGSWVTKWYPSSDPTWYNDYSYYRTSAPGFFQGYTWPYNPTNADNPACVRNTGAVTAGFGDYSYLLLSAPVAPPPQFDAQKILAGLPGRTNE